MIKGLSWPLIMECALASQAGIWGGQANLPFPMTPGFEESDLFWALADRLDADTYVSFCLAAADFEHVEPRWHQAQRTRIERETETTEGEQFPRFWDEFQRLPIDQADLDPSLERQLIDRLGPVSEDGTFASLTTMDEAHWPWGMDVAKLGRLPEEIVDLQFAPQLGSVRKLLGTTTSGRIVGRVKTALEARGVSIRTQLVDDRSAWTRGITSEEAGNGVEPWSLSETGLAWYRTGRSRETPAVLVVGNSPWDFALFYALRRWTSLAWWLPSWLMRDQLFVRQLALQIERLTRNSGRSLVVTTTSTTKQRDRVARELAGWRGPIGAGVARWPELLPQEPGRYFEYEKMGRPSPVLLLGEETPALSTPLPDSAPEGDDHEMRWMVEARIDGWSPIRASSELASKSLLAPAYEHGMVRASRYGLAYFNPDVMTFSRQALASNTVRPKLRPSSLLSQIEARLDSHGWSCEASDKGNFASQTISLFGGIKQTCGALRDSTLRPILDSFQAKKQSEMKVPGRFLSQDQRRYLSFRDIEELSSEKRAADALEDLVKRHVLIRGLSLKCHRCRQEGWYGLDEFSEVFRCRRCSLEQPMRRDWWLGSGEPAWLYRLAEVVHQFLRSDGDLPLLAAWDRFGESGQALALTNELKFMRPDGSSFETDIVLSNGHELWIGEATSAPQIEPLSRLNRLGELADLLSAYGVLLVTSSPHFKKGVRKRFGEVFDGLWPNAEMITGVQRKPTKPR